MSKAPKAHVIAREMPLDLEKLPGPLAGVDEAGRGPLAGPVVAAAVIWGDAPWPEGLTDSKKLTSATRERLYDLIVETARSFAIASASNEEIDQANIRQATFLAMERAVAALGVRPGTALIDGNALPKLGVPCLAIIGGDLRVREISAASVLAKVTRDRQMCDLASAFPEYGWEQNMGYPTRAHREALVRFGATPHHRRSFGPVKAVLAGH